VLRATGEVRRDPHHGPARAALLGAARALEIELLEHLALEESVIFPAIRQHLSREAQALILDELRQRRRGTYQAPPAPAAQEEES